MSIEITEVHNDPNPKHIIIRSDYSSPIIDCSNPIPSDQWLDGTLGETLCVDDLQWMHFEKALCDGVLFTDSITALKVRRTVCPSCGVLNALGCCLNTTPANSYAVQDDAGNCDGNTGDDSAAPV